jgi:hypothetical protein
MKKNIILSFVAALSFACSGTPKPFDSTVNLEIITVDRNSAEIASDSSYMLSIAYFNPVGAPQYLTDSIMKYTKLLFASWFGIPDEFDLETSVQYHMDEYLDHATKNNVPGKFPFRLKIVSDPVYQNSRTVSFTYSWVVDEGGAHNNFGKYCFVLEKTTGRKLFLKDLIRDEGEEELMRIAETEFKTQSGMKPDERMYVLYKFKNNRFHLTETFEFTDTGLIFHFNPYEIAPYSAGLITLTLPYGSIASLINFAP